MIRLIVIAFVLDLLFGDPSFLYHPVRIMGRVIESLHPFVDARKHRILGGAAYLAVLIFFVLLFMAAVRLLPPILFEIVVVYLLFSSLAAHSLAEEVRKVLALRTLSDRRKALSMLCSRDTEALDEHGVLSTLFETNSENSVDGFLAPLFYMIVFAPLGYSVEAALIYKAVSTCDSMVGYRNSRFLLTGKISARMDDLFNLIPARISVPFILLAGFFYKLFQNDRPLYFIQNGIRIYLRDRYRHSSPNSAHPMSVFAGIFGVRICGPTSYFGEIKDKPYIGDEIRPLTDSVVKDSTVVMVLSGVFMLTAGIVLYAGLFQ